jgi:hypothetical protein
VVSLNKPAESTNLWTVRDKNAHISAQSVGFGPKIVYANPEILPHQHNVADAV